MIAKHDWDDGSTLADTVLDALQEMPTVNLENGGPLQESVDLDAVNELFDLPMRDGTERPGALLFYYEDHVVQITNDGLVMIREEGGTVDGCPK